MAASNSLIEGCEWSGEQVDRIGNDVFSDTVQMRSCRHRDRWAFEDMLTCLSCGLTFILVPAPPIRHTPQESEVSECIAQAKLDIKYPYRPLNLSDEGQEIRLLVLHPGKDPQNLKCELVHTKLSDNPGYEALSYTWADNFGNKGFTKEIRCVDGFSVAITANCESALRRLRHEERKRILWVDAICIDQSNTKERNHQVNRMRDIYAASTQAVIYLGQCADNSDRFFEYIAADSPGALPDTRTLAYLFARSWFHRIWVLQEIASAKTAVLYCGSRTVRWKNFTYLALFLHELAWLKSRLHLPSALYFSHPFKSRPFLELLHLTAHCAATDPRDKIFALHGLASDAERLELSIDYRATTPQIFARFALHWIKSYQSLEILSYHVGQNEKEGMATWVPDWSVRSPMTVISPDRPFLGSNNAASEAKAPGWTFDHRRPFAYDHVNEMATITWPQRISFSRGSLIVSARRIGTVSTGFRHSMPIKFSIQTQRIITECHKLDAGSCSFGPRVPLRYKPTARLKYQEREYQQRPTRVLGRDEALGSSVFSSLRLILFWDEFFEALRRLSSSLTCSLSSVESELRSDGVVPAAFGGSVLCHRCQDDEAVYHQLWHPNLWGDIKTLATVEGFASKSCNKDELEGFLAQFKKHGTGRRIFSTEYSMGFGPKDLQDGDTVWLLDGAQTPMALRQMPQRVCEFSFVGPCYVHAAQSLWDTCSMCQSVNRRIFDYAYASLDDGKMELDPERDSLFLSDWQIISIV